MTEYTPDKWLVVRLETDEGILHKVFGSWSGGYLDGDQWRMNSGVESVSEDEDFLLFHGFSGSVYRVHKQMYGATPWSFSVLADMIAKSNANPVVLDEDTDWLNLEGVKSAQGTQ